jgi:hypothetical protein
VNDIRDDIEPLAVPRIGHGLSGKAVAVDCRYRSGLQKAGRTFLPPASPLSDVADETDAESAVAEEKATATAAVESGQATQVEVSSTNLPDQQEIQRRRELVRALFNDFWNGRDDKPVTFLERLNQAEAYLNGQLTVRGEPWQLDADTRKMLGLPPRTN